MIRRLVTPVALFGSILALATGCGGPSPPDGYRQSFIGTLTTMLRYEDPAISSPPSQGTYSVTLLEADEEGVYTTEVGVCPLTLEVGGVPPNGVVQLSPRPFPTTCTYESATGSTVSIEWTSADIDWSPDELLIDLSGPFVSSAEGRPDEAGEYQVFGTLY